MRPDGEVRRSPPKNFGVIGNGHLIKLSHNTEDKSPWDQNFEPEFQRADDNFPILIAWLENLDRKPFSGLTRLSGHFVAQPADDDRLNTLIEGIVSLAVRSPMNREAAVSLAEHFRGPLNGRERNALIGMNMRDSHRAAVKAIGMRGKFAILYSPDREFIYGDGFFHNIISPTQTHPTPKILAPITPRIAVLFARPMSYSTEPKLCTLVVTEDEAEALNKTVQIYAKHALFYRSDRPEITPDFCRGQHLQYASSDNPVDRMINLLSKVSPR